jgi:hypothetical protein
MSAPWRTQDKGNLRASTTYPVDGAGAAITTGCARRVQTVAGAAPSGRERDAPNEADAPAAAASFRRRHVLNLKASASRKGGGASTPYLRGETRTHGARVAHMVAASGGCLPDSPRS